MRRVADAIVERLRAHDTRQIFTVAGESYLDVLDALYDASAALHVVTCRHEAAAANMAEATAKLTGRPGVAFVTRNPDFVALARAYGLAAWRVAATKDFGAALEA